MTTTNLGLTLIDENQTQKAAAANAAIQGLEDALTDTVAVAAANTPVSVSSADYRANIHLSLSTGTATAAFDVLLPALKGAKIVTNGTAYTATIGCTGAATGAAEATINAGATALVYNDGTQVFRAA